MDCAHLESMTLDVAASGDGCVECLATGGRWVHLRRCLACGHIGCCDSSPGRHATAHFHEVGHPVVQSFEPGEEWIWCFADEIGVEIEGAAPSPSHP
jgi:uncharacterized UBP type Zn finger protein